jgi:hypothetical protein
MSDLAYSLPVTGGPVEVRGSLNLERTAVGVLPRRLPAWAREQFPDALMDDIDAQPSGVRLALRTAASVLEVGVLATATSWDGEEPGPAPFDLVIDGKLVARVPAPRGNVLLRTGSDFLVPGVLQRGEPGRVRFDALPPGVKDVEVWLPQHTPVELTGLWADAEILPPSPPGLPRWVHHGSSISHCVEADGPTGTWPVIAAGLGRADLLNLGLGGNAMLDPYTARTIRDQPADLISLKLGINILNAASFRLRTFGPAVHGFLDTVREGHPDTPLLVISPIICPAVEDTPGPTDSAPGPDGTPQCVALGDPADIARGALTSSIVRTQLAEIVARRTAAGDAHLHYLDGRELFGSDDLADLPDGLHPNAAGYRRMGERFAAIAFGPGGVFAS